MSSSDSALSCCGRFSNTTAIGSSRSTTMRGSAGVMSGSPAREKRAWQPSGDRSLASVGPLTIQKCLHRLLSFLSEHRQCEPVARVVHGLVPGQVAPEVELLLRITRRLGELLRELLDDLVDLRVELRGRDD